MLRVTAAEWRTRADESKSKGCARVNGVMFDPFLEEDRAPDLELCNRNFREEKEKWEKIFS